MVTITPTKLFLKSIKHLDSSQKIKLDKQIQKIAENPIVGKTMRFERKGTREVYLHPFRLSYLYDAESHTLFLLEVYHKNRQ